MRHTTLGKSNLNVSAVGFGGIPIMRLTDDEAVAVVRRCLDLGVTFIDTASGYGDSQKKIGRAIKGRRDGLVLATKTGRTTREEALEDVERSRREMGVDVIDLYQLHGVSSPDKWKKVSAPGGALEGLLEAREKGHVAHVGYTSHNLDTALELATCDVFETVQFPFNLVTREPGERMIAAARERNLGFIVMKPMCGGQFDDAELAFKFLNDYPDLVPIPGIERAGEIEQIVELVESGATLTGDDRVRADRIVQRLGKLFCRRCGYCQPCPQGIPITTAMIFDSLAKRLPPEKVAAGPAKQIIGKVPLCTDCAACETSCPYDLPIRETIRESLAKARRLAARYG